MITCSPPVCSFWRHFDCMGLKTLHTPFTVFQWSTKICNIFDIFFVNHLWSNVRLFWYEWSYFTRICFVFKWEKRLESKFMIVMDSFYHQNASSNFFWNIRPNGKKYVFRNYFSTNIVRINVCHKTLIYAYSYMMDLLPELSSHKSHEKIWLEQPEVLNISMRSW